MKFGTNPQVEEFVEVAVETALDSRLILFNDDVNSFDFVIEALINVCGHDSIQAEQCTVIVHYKGKCCVKEGEYDNLEPMCVALLDRGLSAEIQTPN